MNQLFPNTLWLSDDLMSLALRFALDFVVVFIIIRYLYYPTHQRKDYLFTYFLFNILIFFLSFLLSGITISVGFAFGLFAVFGILRYRTEAVPIREMTYLFMVITVAVINSMIHQKIQLSEVLFANAVIILITFILERVWLVKHETRKLVIYDKIHLIQPEMEAQLLEDLRLRTGLPVHRIEILRIDLLRDTVMINIFYFSDKISFEEDISNLR
jgi:hypothetical protein